MKEVVIGGVKVTNPDKILFPDLGITKKDVVKYYADVAPLMLEYIKERPLTVIRCHGGDGECFFKRHPTNDRTLIHPIKVGKEEYFYIKSEKELIYQAQMGTIEFHVWGCRVNNIDKPDVMVFDLDPDESLNIKKLREGVVHVKEVLDELKLDSQLKTSGGKGFHITIHHEFKKSWDKFGELSNQIAKVLEIQWPNLFTTNIRKENRHGKIFVDFLRNKKGATCVAPYSLRARKGATLSMPVEWSDLNSILPDEVNIKNYMKFEKNFENY